MSDDGLEPAAAATPRRITQSGDEAARLLMAAEIQKRGLQYARQAAQQQQIKGLTRLLREQQIDEQTRLDRLTRLVREQQIDGRTAATTVGAALVAAVATGTAVPIAAGATASAELVAATGTASAALVAAAAAGAPALRAAAVATAAPLVTSAAAVPAMVTAGTAAGSHIDGQTRLDGLTRLVREQQIDGRTRRGIALVLLLLVCAALVVCVCAVVPDARSTLARTLALMLALMLMVAGGEPLRWDETAAAIGAIEAAAVTGATELPTATTTVGAALVAAVATGTAVLMAAGATASAALVAAAGTASAALVERKLLQALVAAAATGLVSVPGVDAEPTPATSLAPVPVVGADPTPAPAPAPVPMSMVSGGGIAGGRIDPASRELITAPAQDAVAARQAAQQLQIGGRTRLVQVLPGCGMVLVLLLLASQLVPPLISGFFIVKSWKF